MKLEVNIEKKHFFFIFGALLILAGVIYVTAQATPNPGHSPSQVGAGSFGTGAYTFPGSVNIGNPTAAFKLNLKSSSGSTGISLDATGDSPTFINFHDDGVAKANIVYRPDTNVLSIFDNVDGGIIGLGVTGAGVPTKVNIRGELCIRKGSTGYHCVDHINDLMGGSVIGTVQNIPNPSLGTEYVNNDERPLHINALVNIGPSSALFTEYAVLQISPNVGFNSFITLDVAYNPSKSEVSPVLHLSGVVPPGWRYKIAGDKDLQNGGATGGSSQTQVIEIKTITTS